MQINNISHGCMLLVLLLTACTITPDTETYNKIETALQSQPAAKVIKPKTELPPEVMNALLPPVNIDLEAEKRFDVSVVGAPAQDFFMGLTADSPYNMIVPSSVIGDITLNLKDVTIPEVMDTMHRLYGYEYKRTALGFRVLPRSIQSRIFQVNFLNLRRSGHSEIRVSSGQVSESGGTSAGASAVASGGSGGAAGQSDSSGRSATGSSIQTESDSDFWKSFRTTIAALIGSDTGRQVIVNADTGIVIVRAMPDEMRLVEEYLETTQDILHRQVIIEAKVLEVELHDGYQSGINWAGLGQTASGDQVVARQTGGGSILSGSTVQNSIIKGQVGILDPRNRSTVQAPNSGPDISAFGGIFSLALNFDDFTGFVELLETQGDVQVLSSPRIVTLNNQKAIIKVGTDEFYVTDVETTESAATTTAEATRSSSVELTPFFSGIALDVIPQIDKNGGVMLHIHPSISEVVDQTKTFTVDNTIQSLPLAHSSIRESDSMIYAKSGQLVVIGGLMQNRTQEDVASVPFLGDMYLFGPLFRHTIKTKVKSELVILLRPVVVNNQDSWAKDREITAQRFKNLHEQMQRSNRMNVYGGLEK